MGIFDFLNKEKRAEKRLERNIRRANNKFTPKDYRQPSLQYVIEESYKKSPQAISGLIARFAVNAEPSIEDEKEKEWVFETLVDVGHDCLPQLQRALRTAESVTWVQRVLRKVVTKEDFKKELLDVLSDFDTEYERNPDRKRQTIMALGDLSGEDVVTAVLRFLEDVDETVRFQAVGTLVQIADESARESLLKTMTEDESIRVRNEVIDGFATLGWLTTGFKKKIDELLPQGYKHDKSGKIVKLGSSSQ